MRRMAMGIALAAALAAALTGLQVFLAAEEKAPQDGPPEWFKEEMALRVRGSGRWITDNSAYKSEEEPYDQYGMEWKYGLGRASITGRLFGLVDGKEVATFWELRSYWHPGEKKVHAFQLGGHGVVGIGTTESAGQGKTRTTQTFYNLDGTTFQVGHEASDKGKEHIIRSFNITPGGEWKVRRDYVWRLEE